MFGVSQCGLCQGTSIHFVCRHVDTYVYYEAACQNPQCRARLKFGQAKDQKNLFIQKKDKEGNWKPNGGWEKWSPDQQQQKPPPREKDRLYDETGENIPF